MDQHSFLASTPLFDTLLEEERREMLRLAIPVSFPVGHRIFEQGDAADGMYLLQRGRVQVWARLLGEEQMALVELQAGDLLGELALIDRGERSASAEVTEAVEGCFIGIRRFDLMSADDRPAARKTVQQLRLVLCRRLRAAALELAASPSGFYARTQHNALPPSGPPTQMGAAELDPAPLRLLPFFERFTKAELQVLLSPLVAWTLPRGHLLYGQGEPSGPAYAIIRGAIEVTSGSKDNWRRQAIVGPGRLFGLVAPLDGGPRETGAIVREDAVVLEIPQGELLAHLQGSSWASAKLVDAVHTALSESLRSANRTLLAQSAMGRVGLHRKWVGDSLPPGR